MANNLNKVLAVIPARCGSKGIPDKNLRLLGNRPLIHYSVLCAQRAKMVDRVIVSTDDEKIAKVARRVGAEVPFLRPVELSTDSVSLVLVIIHAVRYLEDIENWKADIVASIQPTSPFLEPETIDRAVEILLKSGADSVVTVKQILHEHPFWAKKLQDGRVLPFNEHTDESYLQRQDLPPAHIYDGALYVRRRSLLDNWTGKDFCLGKDIRGVISPGFGSLHIDGMIDLEAARGIYTLIKREGRSVPLVR